MRLLGLLLSVRIPPGYPQSAPPMEMSLVGKGLGGSHLACWRLGRLLQLTCRLVGSPMVADADTLARFLVPLRCACTCARARKRTLTYDGLDTQVH